MRSGCFQMNNAVTGIELRLDDLDKAAATRRTLEKVLDPERYQVQTWYDLQKSLYDVMRLEKWGRLHRAHSHHGRSCVQHRGIVVDGCD